MYVCTLYICSYVRFKRKASYVDIGMHMYFIQISVSHTFKHTHTLTQYTHTPYLAEMKVASVVGWLGPVVVQILITPLTSADAILPPADTYNDFK